MKKIFFLILLISILGGGTLYWEKIPTEQNEIVSVKEYRREGDYLAFSYPDTFSLRTISDDESETIILESPHTKGIQLFTVAKGELDMLTKEGIEESAGGMNISNFKEVFIGKERIPGVSFGGESNGITTEEIWFIHTDYLYELTTYSENEPTLNVISESLHFSSI